MPTEAGDEVTWWGRDAPPAGLRPVGVALPPAGEPPPPGAGHLWVVAPDTGHAGTADGAPIVAGWRAFLTPDDSRYVDGHRHPADRRLTTVSRSLVRLVAAHYLGRAPDLVRIDRRCRVCGRNGHGPPEVAGGDGLAVSVSHSAGRVLVAAVGAGSVGVDVEAEGAVEDPDALAEIVLTPQESASYGAQPESRRAEWLLRAWVRKEAALKAHGEGLSADCARVDVRGDRVVVPGESRVFHLRDVVPADGYVAALATTSPLSTVETFAVRLT